jgi:hypothetical protein
VPVCGGGEAGRAEQGRAGGRAQVAGAWREGSKCTHRAFNGFTYTSLLIRSTTPHTVAISLSSTTWVPWPLRRDGGGGAKEAVCMGRRMRLRHPASKPMQSSGRQAPGAHDTARAPHMTCKHPQHDVTSGRGMAAAHACLRKPSLSDVSITSPTVTNTVDGTAAATWRSRLFSTLTVASGS